MTHNADINAVDKVFSSSVLLAGATSQSLLLERLLGPALGLLQRKLRPGLLSPGAGSRHEYCGLGTISLLISCCFLTSSQNRSTPLMIAAHYDRADIVEELLRRGASQGLRDSVVLFLLSSSAPETVCCSAGERPSTGPARRS